MSAWKDCVTIVSGLPRSGTSMMMAMLEAGGIPTLVDNIRKADDDNPKGYYEFERVKKVKEDKAWLDEAKGKVVKAISQLLLDLPNTHHYKIIFMRRAMKEVLASQQKMLERRGTAGRPVSDQEMGQLLQAHVDQVVKWLDKQPFIEWTPVDYNDMLCNPLPQIEKIERFLGGGLNTGAMAEVVDPELYRQRKVLQTEKRTE